MRIDKKTMNEEQTNQKLTKYELIGKHNDLVITISGETLEDAIEEVKTTLETKAFRVQNTEEE